LISLETEGAEWGSSASRTRAREPVRIRVEQADRDTLDAAGLELRHHGLDLRQGKGDEHRAVGTDPLADLEAEVARHQGLGLAGKSSR